MCFPDSTASLLRQYENKIAVMTAGNMFGFLKPNTNSVLFLAYRKLVMPSRDDATIIPALISSEILSYFSSFFSSMLLHPSQNRISFKKVNAPDRQNESKPTKSVSKIVINSDRLNFRPLIDIAWMPASAAPNTAKRISAGTDAPDVFNWLSPRR